MTTPPEDHPPMPFIDVAAMRRQDVANLVPTVKEVTVVSVRAPRELEFIRVHADEDLILDAVMWKDNDDGAWYLLDPSRIDVSQLPKARPTRLFTAINRHGVVFLLPAPIPGITSQGMAWHISGFDFADAAKREWVARKADKSEGRYDILRTTAALPEPKWPENLNMSELANKGFRDRYVASEEHPVLRRARGEL